MGIVFAVILVCSTLFKCGLLILSYTDIGAKKIFINLRFLSRFPKFYLVPIIGNLLLLNRNKEGMRIKSLTYLLLELTVVISIITLFNQHGLTFDLIFKLLWIVVFLFLAVFDFNSRKLPNHLMFPLICILIFIIPFWNVMGYERSLLGLSGYMGSIINTSFISIVLAIFGAGIYYAYPGFIGGGDIKLIVFTGLLFGFPDSLIVIYLSIMIGAVFSVIKMIIDKTIRSVTIPFGAVLALSAVIVILSDNQLRSAYEYIVLG